ncbi:hypothetical protein STCU_11342 [Strigomonas culicis]|uniref:DUF1977 domain-containing protein n=1 Tax=Strigomonas culicis TaxID=28005 RepID=S9V0P4_9TRYP|nr:hypothetical protein STCU_11342 [Strigomonas culicis]|eukprot:EPY16375.1 hypothetical protein STCU_11342 [Strigomonas culicis]
MFLPFLLFVLLALLLQSNMFDMSDPSGPNSGTFHLSPHATGAEFRAQMKKSGLQFSLTPDPAGGLRIQRRTSLHGLQTTYYVNQRWEDMLRRSKQKRELLTRTEEAVLEAQRDYLAHRCEAESQQQRAQKRAVAPEVCGEYHRYRKALA